MSGATISRAKILVPTFCMSLAYTIVTKVSNSRDMGVTSRKLYLSFCRAANIPCANISSASIPSANSPYNQHTVRQHSERQHSEYQHSQCKHSDC